MIEFITNLEALLEMQPDTLKSDSLLKDIPSWDSMAVVGFLAMADATYGKSVAPAAILKCATVSDLAALVGVS